jgi:hypothetical protein
LVIHVNYDSSVTTLTNAAQVETAFATAVQTLEDLYTNDATINISMYWGPTGPFTSGISLGRSEYELVFSTYPEIVNALSSHRASAADTNSVASLPENDPTGNGTDWLINLAEARALDFANLPSDEDGQVGFASNVSYTFDPNNRIVPGKYDFIGVAEHEISEVLGRNTLGLQTQYVPYDLFRFTNNGARNFNPTVTNAYFSVDNGATVLRAFYTNAALGDIQDWKTSGPADAYDAFVPSGYLLPLSPADITTLDVLGYNGPGLAAPRVAGTKLVNGNFQLKFANTPGTSFTVLATTNLAVHLTNWAVLGTPTENPTGLFQFTDTSATNQQRYYKVRSP